jgi:hypothetical protein
VITVFCFAFDNPIKNDAALLDKILGLVSPKQAAVSQGDMQNSTSI